MKQWKWIVIFALLAIVCACIWLLPQTGGNTVCVYQNGQLLRTIDLRQDQTLTVVGPAGENVVTVADGEIFVSQAGCPDQVCVRHGALKKTGGPIVCLPNRLSIEWEKRAAGVDAVSGAGGMP